MERKVIAEKLNFPVCKNHNKKIGEFKISTPDGTIFLCKSCFQKLKNVEKIRLISSEEEIPLRSSYPNSERPGSASYGDFGQKQKPRPVDAKLRLKLSLIWSNRKNLSEEKVKIYGNTIDAIRILVEENGDYIWYYFSPGGVPLFSRTSEDECFLEYFSGEKIKPLSDFSYKP